MQSFNKCNHDDDYLIRTNMPGLRLRLNKSGSNSPDAVSNFPPPDLKTPRAIGESSAMDEWNRKRAMKLKTSPPTNVSISSSSFESNDYEHSYLSPLKISPSHESPPKLLYVKNQPRHGRVSPKSALFIFMAAMSFTVGTLMNWNDPYVAHPRSATFDTMPQHNSQHVNQHSRTLWSSNFKHDLTNYVEERPEDLADMDMTGQSINDSNDVRESDDSQPNKGVPKVTGDPEVCVPKAQWQTTSYPTCNNIHEIDIMHSVGQNRRAYIFPNQRTGRRYASDFAPNKSLKQKQEVDVEFKGQGWFRTAWALDRETSPFKVEYDDDEWKTEYRRDEQVILKTLRIERDFAEEFFELHRRDAIAMERLTQSPHVLDIYGYCGQSTLNEFASHGTLRSMLKYRSHKKKRLNLAYEIAKGVSDIHSIDYADFTVPTDGSDVSLKTSNATMVHYDLNWNNVAIVDGRYPKLNDFNVAMFLAWDPTKKATCGFEGRFREPWWRSPEEMKNHIDDGTDFIPLTEKVDVYSLGNILWSLLTGTSPWKKNNKMMDELRPRVARGEMPTLPSKFANSTDLSIVAIKNAMYKCLEIDPEKRASAGEIAHDLKVALKEVKRREKEEKQRKKEEEKVAKLAEEEEKKKKTAEEVVVKVDDGEVAISTTSDVVESQEMMLPVAEQNAQSVDDIATETDLTKVRNE